jgi:hypothetical protein
MAVSHLSMDYGVLPVDYDLAGSRHHKGGHEGLRVLALLGAAIDEVL